MGDDGANMDAESRMSTGLAIDEFWHRNVSDGNFATKHNSECKKQRSPQKSIRDEGASREKINEIDGDLFEAWSGHIFVSFSGGTTLRLSKCIKRHIQRFSLHRGDSIGLLIPLKSNPG
jgi:hypothetical protein